MKKDTKDNITVGSALGMLIFGVILTISAFLVPPVGEVHDSILWILGQSLIYAGGALGIANYARSSAHEAVEELKRELSKKDK